MHNHLLLILLALSTIAYSQQTKMLDHNSAFSRNGGQAFIPEWKPFYHGVASGDALADRVIIWTRVTPDSMNTGPVEVDWRVATGPELEEVVQNGTFVTDTDRDYTVKVDVAGLQSGTTYYYGFSALGRNSLTGKTKTTPSGNSADHLKFAVASCANYQHGYFNNYHHMAKRTDLDAVIFLGDYIYENADGEYGEMELFEKRSLDPAHELLTLEDYRRRYSLYRLDTNLSRAHQQHPFICVWDDHESADNSYPGGSRNHTDSTEGNWADRLDMSKQAYFEWMPVREKPDQQIYRTINYGDLADLFMLDTRQAGRDMQVNSFFDSTLQDTGRTILGKEQLDWLTGQLNTSPAKWKLIGNQVLFSPINTGWATLFAPSRTFDEFESISLDSWNGYPAERRTIIEFLEDHDLDNVIFLTGDNHVGMAFDVLLEPAILTFEDVPGLGTTPFYSLNPGYDPATGNGSVAVEFTSSSITSGNFDFIIEPLQAFILESLIKDTVTELSTGTEIGNPNPHLKYADLIRHGYYILDLKTDSAQANWYYSDILLAGSEEEFDEAWYSLSGENRLHSADGESEAKTVQDIPAPPDPPLITPALELAQENDFLVLGLYPNPAVNDVTLFYALNERSFVNIGLYGPNGQLVADLFEGDVVPGVYSVVFSGEKADAGMYFFRIQVGNKTHIEKIILIR